MKMITKEILQDESNKKHNNNYIIIGEYINTRSKIEILHKVCNNIFIQNRDKHIGRKQGCPICFGKHRLTKEILQERSNIKYNKEYIILGDYINSSTPILIRHKICGSEYLQIPNNHLRDRKCFKCYGTPKKSNNEFQMASNKTHNNEYILISNYIGSNDIVTLKHKVCNKEFDIIAFSHIKGGKCKYCTNSKGENSINNFLLENKINFIKGKSFDGCKFKNKLRFDFYLPDNNMCIEYDGVQHFEPIEYFGGKDSLISNRIKDEIKNKWCSDNSVKLLRISYRENIEDILKKLFNI